MRKALRSALETLPYKDVDAAFLHLWEALIPTGAIIGAGNLLKYSWDRSTDRRYYEVSTKHRLAGRFNAEAKNAAIFLATALGLDHEIPSEKEVMKGRPNVLLSIHDIKERLHGVLMTKPGTENRHTAVEQLVQQLTERATDITQSHGRDI